MKHKTELNLNVPGKGSVKTDMKNMKTKYTR